MSKSHLFVVLGGAVAGYLLAANLAAYQPFTMAYAQGAKLAS